MDRNRRVWTPIRDGPMGWTAYYEVIRGHGLSSDEVAAIADLVRRQRKLAWDSETFSVAIAPQGGPGNVVAMGMTKMAMDEESGDSAQLATAITELVRAIPGGELRVGDDFGMFGWDERDGCVVGGGRPTAALVDPPRDGFVAPDALAPVAPAAIASDVPGLVAQLAALDREDQKREIVDRLAACDPVEVARAIYAAYLEVGREHHARAALYVALERITDVQAIASDFLDAWRNGRGTYFYGDLPLPAPFCDAIAQVPEVVDQLVADVAAAEAAGDEELPHRRAEVALDLLARATAPRAMRALLELIRRYRGRRVDWRLQLYLLDRAHFALGAHGDARAVPSLLHYLGTMTCLHRAHESALRGLARLAPARARPLLIALSDAHGAQLHELLVVVGGAETAPALRRLAQHPVEHVRASAAAGLQALGEAPAPYIERAVEDRAVDADRRIRADALDELSRSAVKDRFLSLVLADALDKHLRAQIGDSVLGVTWSAWRDLVPAVVLDGSTALKVQWAQTVGRSVLGEQAIWPSVAPVLTLGPAAVCASYPAQLVAFDPATLAALAADEAAILAALE